MGLGVADYAIAALIDVPSGMMDARMLIRPIRLVVGRQPQWEVHIK